MKTQGNFLYTVNSESKTKEDIDSMDLSNMNCTIDGLIVSYFFPVEKRSISSFYDLHIGSSKEKIRTKTEEILDEVDKYQQQENGGVLKGGEFPYDFIEDFITSQKKVSKDDVITKSSRGEKEMLEEFKEAGGKERRLDDLKNALPEGFIDEIKNRGIKESKTVEKAPVFTYCKQMKNAIEALALRSLYGHKKYEVGDDWENFSRVENGDFEYSNAQFRHALGIGEEDEKNHRIAEAWNAVTKLEIFLREHLEKSK